jgi:hypothetical protein
VKTTLGRLVATKEQPSIDPTYFGHDNLRRVKMMEGLIGENKIEHLRPEREYRQITADTMWHRPNVQVPLVKLKG